MQSLPRSRRPFPLTATLLASLFTATHADQTALECLKHGRFLAPAESSDARKYAPDRGMDALHIALDVTPDFARRTVRGSMTLKFKPIARPQRELRLDAVRLNIASVTSSAAVKAWQNTDTQLVITFDPPIEPGRETSVTVAYSAEPSEGLYFRTPEMGYKTGEAHLFSQGEAIEARHWFPCFDAPVEKLTSEITCHVPEGMTVISNGKQISESTDPATRIKTVRWLQDKPHVNYLISLVAGYFKSVDARHGNVPLRFFTLPSEIAQAPSSFQDTKDAMAFFEKETGVAYPWDKYDQVCVNDFVAGGMENTSATTLTDGTLFAADSENIHSSQGLVAHELAHQWFGDLVTCKDWSHLWLNEGFATYYAHLYDGHKNGRDHMLYGLYHDARSFIGAENDTTPIVWRGFDVPMDQFGFRVYPKGSWVLHMLRSQLGEDLYRRCIQTYLERHRFGSVVTEDLNRVIEELSGRSFDQFFDQYVYHAHQPELALNYSWDEATHLAKVSIAQNQKLSDNVLLFRFPVTVRFKVKGSIVDREILVKEKAEDFYFDLPAAPEIVRFDPNFSVLAKVSFSPANAMLRAQIQDESDVIGRLIAIEALGKRSDQEAVDLLKDRLQKDSFFGVRVEAAKALRGIHTPEADAALRDSTRQPDARVRHEVVNGLGRFYSETTRAALAGVVESEKNTVILANALVALAPYHDAATRDLLIKHLHGTSYHGRVAGAAIRAMRAQDDPSFINPLLETLKKQPADFDTGVWNQGLETLGWLARHETSQDAVREFLLGQTTSLRKPVRLAAINALGTLGDPKASAALESFANSASHSPEREPAKKALESIHSNKKPGAELKDVRDQLLNLQRTNKDLRKELDDLKKKFEARATSEKPAAAKKEKSSRNR